MSVSDVSVEALCELAAENADGADWYDQAAREIKTVCDAAGWDCEQFTGILAVTSPRVSVARNVRITLHWMQTGELLDNVMTAIRRSVASAVAMSPRDCQAALWAGQLRSRGRKLGRMNITLEYTNQRAYGSFPTTGSIEQRGCADGSFQARLF